MKIHPILFSLLAMLVGTCPAIAQDDANYIGVWRSGSSAAYLKSGSSIGATRPDFRGPKGLVKHEVRLKGAKIYHYGLWAKGHIHEKTGTWQSIMDFKAASSNSAGRSMPFITQIEVYIHPISKKAIFNVAHKAHDRQRQTLERTSNWRVFVETWKKRITQRMRLKRMVTYEENGKRWFVGLYDEGNYTHYLHNLAGWSNFTKKWEELGKKNYRLVDIETYFSSRGIRYYVGIWEPGNDGYYLWNVKGFNNFAKKFVELNGKMRLVDFEVVY